MSFWSRFVTGLAAFREAYLSSDVLDEYDFTDYDARRVRYNILWALFENTAYSSVVHSWATSYKNKFALYKHIRPIYNPAARIGTFWQAHLLGGTLDSSVPSDSSAIPIVTPVDNSPLREAISDIWEWSNWQWRKDLYTLYGTVFGDTFLKIVDDTEREKVYIEVVHPGTVAALDVDAYGNVKGYTIEYETTHPDSTRTVTYTETAERDGVNVVYKTYLNGAPYAWGDESEWEVPYGFVPLVQVKHIDVGLDYGWSELHSGISKFREVDDLSSFLTDQIRKTINVVWFMTGQTKPKDPLTLTGADTTDARPHPTREEVHAIYASSDKAKAQALVAPLNIEHTSSWIGQIMERLEEEYPELRFEKLRLSAVSGATLREARKPVSEKVVQRRAGYDTGLIKAQQMAVSIGGYRNIFPFSIDSYDSGALDHTIGERPVFTDDEHTKLERDKLFWQGAELAKKAGVPLTAYLLTQGWTSEEIATITDTKEYKEQQEAKAWAMAGFGTRDGDDEDKDKDKEEDIETQDG